MTRELTAKEREGLDDVLRPFPKERVWAKTPTQGGATEWWAHCQSWSEKKGWDAEKLLADKLARHKPALDARKAASGTYRNRAERARDADAVQKASIAAKLEARTYDEKRKEAYGSWESQMEMQADDKKDDTDTWGDHIAAVKAAHPKD